MNDDTYIELQTIGKAAHETIAAMVAAVKVDYGRLDELRELRNAGHYVTGSNMPGFMPDETPDAYEGIKEARGALKESITRYLEESDLAPDLDPLPSEWPDTEGPAAEFSATIYGRCFFMTFEPRALADPTDAEELHDLEEAAGDCTDQDDAETRIHEDPLCIEYRSDWQTPGETLTPAEFTVLLTTGGPAVRLIGEFDHHNSPHRVRLQSQNWGTPWTEYMDADPDILQSYCELLSVGSEL